MEYETVAEMADEEVLFDDVYELCEIIGKWVDDLITLNFINYRVLTRSRALIADLTSHGLIDLGEIAKSSRWALKKEMKQSVEGALAWMEILCH